MITSDASTHKKMPVIELFGPTIQGEGLMSGTLSHFLRFGGCPLRCVWCDSMNAVDPQQVKDNRTMMDSTELLGHILGLPWTPWITLTGGDPCMHSGIVDLLPALNGNEIKVAVETQGTLFPDWLCDVDLVTFSPKPPSSNNEVAIEPILNWLLTKRKKTQRICIKVVVDPEALDDADFAYALRVYQHLPENIIDAFYFTALTSGAEIDRLLTAVHGYQLLASKMISAVSSGQIFHTKTHVGCQQHVILWPNATTGV